LDNVCEAKEKRKEEEEDDDEEEGEEEEEERRKEGKGMREDIVSGAASKVGVIN
jgi:hypothetical protein